jgi:hypothetical protein
MEAWYHPSIARARGFIATFESDKHVKTFTKPDAKGLVVAPNGQVTPEMDEILRIIARENLVLATGHVHPEEVIAVVRRGRELGVKNMLITHACAPRCFTSGSCMRPRKDSRLDSREEVTTDYVRTGSYRNPVT